MTGGTDNRRARPRAPVVIADGGQTGVCPGSNQRTVMMADGDDGVPAPMAYGTDNRRCTGRERPAYNQAPRWGECAEGGPPWRSHTGVAVPNRAHEFVPEGRLSHRQAVHDLRNDLPRARPRLSVSTVRAWRATHAGNTGTADHLRNDYFARSVRRTPRPRDFGRRRGHRSPWQSHTGIAVPNRAHEFVPAGRLILGRPFTTCATTCPVPVPISPFPPYRLGVRHTPRPRDSGQQHGHGTPRRINACGRGIVTPPRRPMPVRWRLLFG
jgi:hypothetical protein